MRRRLHRGDQGFAAGLRRRFTVGVRRRFFGSAHAERIAQVRAEHAGAVGGGLGDGGLGSSLRRRSLTAMQRSRTKINPAPMEPIGPDLNQWKELSGKAGFAALGEGSDFHENDVIRHWHAGCAGRGRGIGAIGQSDRPLPLRRGLPGGPARRARLHHPERRRPQSAQRGRRVRARLAGLVRAGDPDLDRRLGRGRGLFARRHDRSFRQRNDLAARSRTAAAAPSAAAPVSPALLSARSGKTRAEAIYPSFRDAT